MAIRLDHDRARHILVTEAERAESAPASEKWEHLVEELSQVCEGSSKTHIAFLGTAILAKATDINVDPFSVKAGAGTQGAYSARTFGHSTLVPLAPKLGIDLGVSGREPLNNQPYFRIKRATAEEMLPLVKDVRPVRVLQRALHELERIRDQSEALVALRAFIKVRRRYKPVYPTLDGVTSLLSVANLVDAIRTLVEANSEGGRRAQAAVAALLDAVFGADRVHTGRINDPDRHIPGDVAVSKSESEGVWDRVFEVRDKPVSEEDLLLFAHKAAQEGVPIAAVVAVATRQEPFSEQSAREWARERGVELTVFWGWEPLVSQVVLWSPRSEAETICDAALAVRDRLVEVEASVEAVEMWVSLLAEFTAPSPAPAVPHGALPEQRHLDLS